MSRRKNNIAYVKPHEPAFLTRLKKEAGYKEGPTVDTKREQLSTNSSDDSDNEDQQPQIVVLNPGDLTADEVAAAKKDADEAPADLRKRVIFKRPEKKSNGEVAATGNPRKESDKEPTARKEKVGAAKRRKLSQVEESAKKSKFSSRPALSFNPEGDDEETEDS